jgi:hypothetical protein
MAASGQVEGLARAGKFNETRQLFEGPLQGLSLARAEALIALAETLIDKQQHEEAVRQLNEASRILETFRGQAPWQRLRMIDLAAAAGRPDEAERWLASGLIEPPGQSWARLALLRTDLTRQAGNPADPARIKTIGPNGSPPPAAVVVGHAVVARHNARVDPKGTLAWANALEGDMARAFATAGVALGVRDAR